MFNKKEWIAMLLAGGQGSRLKILTRDLAKPAVPFGGKYRIIDFPLSNCVNSGIDTVGVLTQYQPLVLGEHIGNGQPWDLDRINGGVFMLPPYQKSSGSDWYSGTANAIYQNINFIQRYDPDYVVILSGDHIYKMDYERMLAFHKAHEADCTIAVLEVPWEEASRFGIMTVGEGDQITEFAEKPKEPKSRLASMGIYIFSWPILKEYLTADEADPNSSKDFGKDIIPKLLGDGKKMVAYPFDGYWKDVGTIDSLWEANMDLLNPNVQLDLADPSWKIYSRNPGLPPHFVAEGAKIENSRVAEGSMVAGEVDFSVLFSGATVERGAVVRYSILMPGAVVRSGAVVEFAIVAEDAVIGAGAHVGCSPENCPRREDWGVAVIGAEVQVGPGAQVPAKATVERDLKGGEQL